MRQLSPDGSEFSFVAQYGFSTGGEFETHERQYYKVIGGERIIISEAEFVEFQKTYPALSAEIAREITNGSGIVFVPLFGLKSN